LAITTIILDLDDTLLAQDGVEDEIIEELAQQLGQRGRFSWLTVKLYALRLWSEGPAFAYCNAIGISPGECLRGRFQGNAPELKVLAQWAPTYRQRVWERALARLGKPDPRIFQLVLNRLGAEPSQAVMVGDSLFRDVGGAQSAGLKGIWLIRRDTQREDADFLDITPDAIITSLSELPALLEDHL
jgi:FMN phosphatase YigB (HAD superfamily)